jgi:hypothetical protein
MVIEMPRQLPHPPPSPPSQALLAPTLAAPSSFAGWRSSIPVSPSYALDLSCMWVSSRRRARSFHRLAHSPVPTVNVVGSRLFGAGSAAPASARHRPPPPTLPPCGPRWGGVIGPSPSTRSARPYRGGHRIWARHIQGRPSNTLFFPKRIVFYNLYT